MPICVEIEISDDGKVSVGVEPQDKAEYQEPKDYLQPVQSIEEALAQAKDMLQNGPGQSDQQDQQAPGDEQQGGQTPAQEEASFNQGFQRQKPMGGGY